MKRQLASTENMSVRTRSSCAVRENSGDPPDLLATLGVDAAKICEGVAKIVPPGPCISLGRLPRTPRVIRAIGLAEAEAKHLGHCFVGSEHLLLGLNRRRRRRCRDHTSQPRTHRRRGPEQVTAHVSFIDPHMPMWKNDTVAKIARSIAETSCWEQLPILADALEEAGCTQQDLLKHFRAPAGHTTHCSMLKTMLGS